MTPSSSNWICNKKRKQGIPRFFCGVVDREWSRANMLPCAAITSCLHPPLPPPTTPLPTERRPRCLYLRSHVPRTPRSFHSKEPPFIDHRRRHLCCLSKTPPFFALSAFWTDKKRERERGWNINHMLEIALNRRPLPLNNIVKLQQID